MRNESFEKYVSNLGNGASLSMGVLRGGSGGELLYKDTEEYVYEGSGNWRLSQ